MATLQKQMKQLNTKFDLENTICHAIAEWFETGHISLYPEKFHNTICSQGAIISPRKMFNGKISWYWMENQHNTKTLSGKV